MKQLDLKKSRLWGWALALVVILTSVGMTPAHARKITVKSNPEGALKFKFDYNEYAENRVIELNGFGDAQIQAIIQNTDIYELDHVELAGTTVRSSLIDISGSKNHIIEVTVQRMGDDAEMVVFLKNKGGAVVPMHMVSLGETAGATLKATYKGTTDVFSGGEVESGKTLVVTAILAEPEKYIVSHWEDAEYNTIPSTNGKTEIEYTVTKPATLKVVLKEKEANLCKVTVKEVKGATIKVETTEGGTPSAAGVAQGTALVVKVQVTDNNQQLSKVMAGEQELTADAEGKYSFTIEKDTEVTVVLTPKQKHTVTLATNPVEGGKLNTKDPITAPVLHGTKIYLYADPAEGYKFVSLSDGTNPITEIQIDGDNRYFVYTVMGDVTLTATFQKKEEEIQLYKVIVPEVAGATITLTDEAGKPVPAEGVKKNSKVFVKVEVTDNTKEVESVKANTTPLTANEEGKYPVTVESETTITVVLKDKVSEPITEYTITFSTNDDKMGTIVGKSGTLLFDLKPIKSGDKVAFTKQVSFTATANEGYEIEKWEVDGKIEGKYEKKTTIAIKFTEGATHTVKVYFKIKTDTSVEQAAVATVHLAAGNLVIEGFQAPQAVVYNMLGEVVCTTNQTVVDFGNMPKGIYLVRVNGKVFKVVK